MTSKSYDYTNISFPRSVINKTNLTDDEDIFENEYLANYLVLIDNTLNKTEDIQNNQNDLNNKETLLTTKVIFQFATLNNALNNDSQHLFLENRIIIIFKNGFLVFFIIVFFLL